MSYNQLIVIYHSCYLSTHEYWYLPNIYVINIIKTVSSVAAGNYDQWMLSSVLMFSHSFAES